MMRVAVGASLLTVSIVQGNAFCPKSRFLVTRTMSLRNRKKDVLSNRTPVGASPPPVRGGSSSAAMTAFDNIPMFKGQAGIVGLNLLGFLISLTSNTHAHVDLLGSAAFAAGALPGLLQQGAPTRVQWSSAAVIAWSVRLGGFLFYRILNTGHDARLDEILANPVWCAGFWTYSALWGVLCSLPHSLGMSSKLAGNPIAVKAGAAIFGAGLFTEALADYQKWMFKQSNPGQFCNVGLWSISQHPNWFGNLVLWAGIFVMNASALLEPASSNAKGLWSKLWRYRRVALALLGPLFMWNLFEGQATGRMLPDAHEANLKRYNYGSDPAFTDYIDNTPLIIPNPLKWVN